MDIHPLDEDEMQAAWEAAGDADLDEINQLLVDYCSELIRELVRSQRSERRLRAMLRARGGELN